MRPAARLLPPIAAAVAFVFAGAATEAAPHAPWRYVDQAHGLAGSRVLAVAPGRSEVWVGTDAGLSLFDGVRWRTLTAADGVPGGAVHSLHAEGSGRLWIGAGAGFGLIEDGRWSRLGLPGAAGAPGRVAVAVGVGGVVWLGHGAGLMRYDPSAGTLEPVADLDGETVGALLVDRSGRLWAGTGQGLLRLGEGTWTAFDERDGVPRGRVRALLEDRAGRIWCGTGEGLAVFDGAYWRAARGWGDNGVEAVTTLAEDGEGRVWAGTPSGAGFDDGYRWRWHDARSGLPADEVLAMAADANGNLWFGTSRGLARLDTSWSDPAPGDRDRPAPRSPVLSAGDGTVYLGAERGLLVFRGGETEWIGPRDGLEGAVHSLLEDAEGGVWVGTDAGLARFDGGVAERHVPLVERVVVETPVGAREARSVTVCDRYHGLAGLPVNALAPDGEGGVWVGTEGGLSRLADGAWTCLEEPRELAAGPVRALARGSGGRVWAGTPHGLWELDGGGWRRSEGVPGGVSALLVDSGSRLWAGGERGLHVLDAGRWRTAPRGPGAPSGEVLALFEDSRDRLWAGTGAGAASLADGIWTAWGEQDGLPSPRILAFAEVGDRTWFASGEGVRAHRPDRVPPRTVVRNPPGGPVAVPSYLFELEGGDLETPPEGLRHSWRVDGGAWSAWTGGRLAAVTDLANGRHLFEARTVDREHNVDPSPARVEFEVNTAAFDLELVEASFGPLYASLYQFYAADERFESRPTGRVVVRNAYDRPLRVKISAFVAGLMDFPSDAVALVEPGETREVPLRVEIDERALDLEKTETRQVRLALQYVLGGERKQYESTHPVTVVEKHGMVWEEPERIGVYVTHLDEAVERFARETLRAVRPDEREAIVYDNLLRALALFDALGAHGIRYVPDPGNPYGGIVPGRPVLDVVRLPRETLRGRTGDCDDLAVLYAAVLENVGIDTAIVDLYDHVLVMFDTGLRGHEARQLARSSPIVHVDGKNRIWVPVEVTMVGGSFSEAWRSGAATLAGAARHAVIETRLAWEKYRPLRPRDPAPDIVPPPREAFRTLFLEDVRRQEEALTSAEIRRLRRAVEERPRDAAAANDLGILLARNGYLGRAASYFERVIELVPGFAGGHGNLGNVLYEQGRYEEAVERYERSLELEELPQVHVELALTLCEISRFDLAREHYRRAMELAPELAPQGASRR